MEELLKAEIKRGVKRLTDASVKFIRSLPDIVDRYVEGSPYPVPERMNERHSRSTAPYIIAALIASIGLLLPLCSSLGVFTLPLLSVLYVPIAALVLAALVTIIASLKST